MQPIVSFIILDYFKAEKVLKNIEGIYSQDFEGNFEVLVGDNSECDKNKKKLENGIFKINKDNKHEKISVHIFEKNEGYSKGNNFLVDKSIGDHICIINPDIEWEDNKTVHKLLKYLEENREVGIVSPRQKERTGQDALSIRAFPSFFTQIARRTFLRNIHPFSHRVRKDEMQNIDRSQTQTVDWVQSSFLLISRSFWDELGGFHHRYFLFLADTQLCKDAWDKNKKVIHYADTTVYSDGIRCSEGGMFSFFTSRTLQIHVCDSMKYFWNKYF